MAVTHGKADENTVTN